jgi:DNA polymerase-1
VDGRIVEILLKIERTVEDGTLGVYLGTWRDKNEGIDREWFWNKSKSKIVWQVPEIRECIVARKGYKILTADYSQIEIKLMAFLSKAPEMLKALNYIDASGKPTDIHCYISAMVYGERLNFTYDEMVLVISGDAPGGKKHPRYKEFKRMRSNIKTTTFGVPYGSGAKGVAARCGITEEEAQQVIDDFFKQFPVLKVWLDEQGVFALKNGYTETPYHRKRFYTVPKQYNDDVKENLNYDAERRQVGRCARSA